VSRISVSDASDAGFFFPPLNEDSGNGHSVNDHFGTPWDIWRVVFVGNISWAAVWHSIPTMIALVLFSLIHVPINIPAFALSTNVDVDMNQELIAHGYANIIAGALGGLQNYLAYTQSVLYDKSGGRGRVSGIAVAIVTSVLFFAGPTICSYLPRCMAGTLLLHVGIDLFLEGVWDSIGRFDMLEYCGIWLIVVVMTAEGMEAAMIAGFLAAVSTYVVQNVTYLSPIRGFMSAMTLRSSHWNRSNDVNKILNDTELGRNRILVIQLQVSKSAAGMLPEYTEIPI
jgi:SulP family sulfate permease